MEKPNTLNPNPRAIPAQAHAAGRSQDANAWKAALMSSRQDIIVGIFQDA